MWAPSLIRLRNLQGHPQGHALLATYIVTSGDTGNTEIYKIQQLYKKRTGMMIHIALKNPTEIFAITNSRGPNIL
jgi:hypothetical protein